MGCAQLCWPSISQQRSTQSITVSSVNVSEKNFGCSGAVLSWFKSFLSDRSQYISIGSERSKVSKMDSGVPQGSVLGPLLFSVYVSEIGQLIESQGLHYHQYADDLMIYFSVRGTMITDFNSLCTGAERVSDWFMRNCLLLNPSKTEAIIFGTNQRLKKIDKTVGIRIAGSSVKFSDHIKLLGVTIDSSLTFDRYVSNIVRDCNYHTRALRQIRHFISQETADTVGSAIVGSRLDYCNSLLYGTSEKNLKKLQSTQNRLARVVLRAPPLSSATDLRFKLHWLPVEKRIIHKLSCLTFNAKKGIPGYLGQNIRDYVPCRDLRFSQTGQLRELKFSFVFLSKSFGVAAEWLWN